MKILFMGGMCPVPSYLREAKDLIFFDTDSKSTLGGTFSWVEKQHILIELHR